MWPERESTIPPFAHALVRKSERALVSARIDLRYGDPDGAVNRAYYAMCNAARASLLSAGVSEGDLPRTHNGVIAAFGQHAVKTGRVDPTLGRSFNAAEVLRLTADYTGLEIGPKAAEEMSLEQKCLFALSSASSVWKLPQTS
jgi:uncharacterized protein (UPF0332 family)